MTDNKDENLRLEFERFVGPDKAAEAAQDILEGERLLQENPAPRPSDQLKAQIKSRISLKLMRRPSQSHRFIYQMAAAAAVIIIVFSLSINIKTLNKPLEPVQPYRANLIPIPAAVWDGSNITSDDAELATLSARIDQVEQELSGTKLTIVNGTDTIDELEMELINIDTDFWKG